MCHTAHSTHRDRNGGKNGTSSSFWIWKQESDNISFGAIVAKNDYVDDAWTKLHSDFSTFVILSFPYLFAGVWMALAQVSKPRELVVSACSWITIIFSGGFFFGFHMCNARRQPLQFRLNYWLFCVLYWWYRFNRVMHVAKWITETAGAKIRF